MKAYMVHGGDYMEGCTLAYAETASRAKAVAIKTGWYDEYIYMVAIRMPNFDKYSNGEERYIESNDELPEGVNFFSESDLCYDDAL